MVKEAQEHAVEDKAKREAVESRNQADALVFQAERTISELGDKVDADDKSAVESRITAVRDALKGEDEEAVKSATAELTSKLQEVATKAYQTPEPTPADGHRGVDQQAPGGRHQGLPDPRAHPCRWGRCVRCRSE